LNPCPLNVCCNIRGQCGINEQFCIEKRGPAGNPGTSPANTNGCVSSCGVDIHNTDGDIVVPYGRVGYYESWNFNRKCLWLCAANANTNLAYTHIHWAFVEVDPSDWTVKIADPYNQWEDFKALDDMRRIISFGGWGYLTEPEMYNILCQVMSLLNHKAFITNVAAFVTEHELDSVDFDWEYPGVYLFPSNELCC
jgi:GH18 family chitinase